VNYLAVLHAGGRIFGRADIGLAAGRALQAQLGRGGLVGEMHHHAAGRTHADEIGIGALLRGGRLDARAVFVFVVGGETPAPDQVLRREGRRQRRQHGRLRRRFFVPRPERRGGGASAERQSEQGQRQDVRQSGTKARHGGSLLRAGATLRGNNGKRKRAVNRRPAQAINQAAMPAAAGGGFGLTRRRRTNISSTAIGTLAPEC